MKKIADGFYKKTEFVNPSDGVSAVLTIDYIDGEDLDTYVNLDGGFCIAGCSREEFFEKLSELIDEYRI